MTVSSRALQSARDDTHREKPLCECRTFSFVFVLEENIGIAPILFGYAFAPGAKLRVVVVGAAQSLISPLRRRDDERIRIAHFIGIARAQRGVASAEDVEYFFVHPRLVTKFESDARLARHDGDELAQARRVFAKVWRKLKEHRSEFLVQRRSHFEE